MLAVKYKPPFSGTNQRQKGIPTINSEIFEIIDSNTFWDHLLLITKILEPYCKLLNILQCDKARLFQVVHSLGYLVQFWMNQPNNELATHLIAQLERWWEGWEHPLLLLSCVLHPEY